MPVSDNNNLFFNNNDDGRIMDTMNIYEACLAVGCLLVIFGLLQLAAAKMRDEE